MTDLEKKSIYDKGYAHWLKYYKNEFKEYCSCSKLPVGAKLKVIEHIKAIFGVMKECGVCMYPEKVKEPMEDVASVMLQFGTPGDPESIYDFMISSKTSCWRTVMFEQTLEEIEAAVKSRAQTEVDMAEWKEKREAEEAEKKRKEEEEWKARHKEEEEWRAKCKKDMDEWQAKENAKKVEPEAWYDSVKTELDKIRVGQNHWYAEDHLSKIELDAVKKYASSMLDFTNAQNNSLTGMGLYSFNEARANAHEELLEVFGLEDNEQALHVTKSYDFSADYDYKMSMYKLLPEDIVVNMLGFALVECVNNKYEN